jgi:predicted N-acetyltransferase YhbS
MNLNTQEIDAPGKELLAQQIKATNAMSASQIQIHPATGTDLDSINRVIEAAVMTWALPERVKRLSLQVYRYTHQDFVHLGMVVAENSRQQILGVAAWEEADPTDAPEGYRALLLHGLYVEPSHHRQGIGRRLFMSAEAAVRERGCDGILVKAQQDATAFFESMEMCSLPAADPLRHYAHRFWKTTP